MATNITISTGGTTTVVTVPEKQNTISVFQNQFTTAEQNKLAGIEAGATADMTGAEIKAAYEAEPNAFTDALKTKLDTIEVGATADQSITTTDGLSGGAASGNVTLTVDSTVVRTTGNQSIAGTKTFTGSLSVNGAYDFPTTIGSATQVLKVNSAGNDLEFGDASVVAELNDLSDVNAPDSDYNSTNLLYNALCFNGSQWVIFDPPSQSPVSNQTNVQFLGGADIINLSKIGLDGANNALSINSTTSYGASGVNLFVDGKARIDGAIEVSSGGTVEYSLPAADGTANQLLATNGSGAVTFVTPSVTNLSDVTSAGSGAIITSAERTKLTGIATGATANDTDANLKNRANHTGTQTASTISDFNTQADARIAAASIDDLSDVDTSTVAPTDGQALVWDNANSKWEPGTVSGGSSPWTTSGNNIYYNTGNVGIGTTSPAAALHVADSNGEIHVEDTTNSLTTKMILAGNNVIIGTNQSGTLPSTGGHIKIGPSAGAGQTVQPSVAIGNNALRSNNGQYHVAIGSGAIRFGGGSFSSAVGDSANAQGGSYNATLGYKANQYSSYNYNTAIGAEAAKGASGTSTFSNTVAVGYQALSALTTGASNTAVGYQASKVLTSSVETTNIGYQAGLSGTSGASYNTYIGHQSGMSGSSAQYNTMVGHKTGTTNSTGDNNTSLGAGSSLYLLSGGGNVAIGSAAMRANSTGSDNVMIGHQSGRNATGSSNVFIGHDSGYNETGSNKLYIENSNSTDPLIYGEFDNDLVRVNGDIQVGKPESNATDRSLIVSGYSAAKIGFNLHNGWGKPEMSATFGGTVKFVNNGNNSSLLTFQFGESASRQGAMKFFSNSNNAITFGTNAGYPIAYIGPNEEGNNYTGGLLIKTRNGTSNTNDFYFSKSGNFGIGTTTPSKSLDVNGDANISGSLEVTEGITINKTADTDFSYNGDVMYFGSGSTTQGELCYLNSSGGWTAADADAASSSGGVLLAIALGTDPDVDGMLLKGTFTLDHDPGTIGDELYVSTTAGDITGTAPSATGDIVRVVGYCLDSTNGQIWFNPSNDFITLA